MYFSSPARTRWAFGPGRAVLILGPAIKVLVGMGILLTAVFNFQWFVVGSSAQAWKLSPEVLLGPIHRADYVPQKICTGRIRLIAAEKIRANLGGEHCQVPPGTA